MELQEVFKRIKKASKPGGFTILDVIPEFPEKSSTQIQEHLLEAVLSGMITLDSKSLCMYPTQKLMDVQ